MSQDETPLRDEAGDEPEADWVPHSRNMRFATRTWVSRLVLIICVVIFAGLAFQGDYESWEALSKFGVLSADAIWLGGYWALITSVFVHFEVWHLAFNLYWLWVLGSRMEAAVGSMRYLQFFLLAGFVSSSCQLAVSDGSTGIGASGVGYAIFGFMWQTRYWYPRFTEVINQRVIQLFLIWLVACFVVTRLEIWEVGNAAHLSGLLFGAAAGLYVTGYKPRLMLGSLIVMVALAIVPLVWCPWSVGWLSHKAYQAHLAGEYERALEYYDRVIERDPVNAWAYGNRSSLHFNLGHAKQAIEDMKKAQKLDPEIATGK